MLARSGVGSRRACEELIAAGRVTVNGEVAGLGRRVDPEHDEIEVDGALIAVAAGLVHYLLNKPAGVVTTAVRPAGPADRRRAGAGCSRGSFPSVASTPTPRGCSSSPTTDHSAHRLTHPRFGIDKEYVAEVRGAPRPAAVRALRRGVELDDGLTAPAKVSLVGPSVLRITIHEGRNRQVRRMCEAVGHPVVRLVRTRIGPISRSAARRRVGGGRSAPDEVRALAPAAGGRRTPAAAIP